MPSALPVDLRKRVVAAIEAGESCRQAAKRFGVGTATAIRWHERFRQEGRIAPKLSVKNRNQQGLEAQDVLILRTYEENPRAVLREIRDRLIERGLNVSLSRLSRFFARHGISRKNSNHAAN